MKGILGFTKSKVYPMLGPILGALFFISVADADLRDLLPPAVQNLIRNEQENILLTEGGAIQVGDPERYAVHQNTQNHEFRPESGRLFLVESYWVNEADWHVFSAAQLPGGLEVEMRRTNSQGIRQIRLLVHPESRQFWEPYLRNAQRAENYHALATSSSRTLLVWRDGNEARPFFAKLTLDRTIGGSRRMRPSEMVRSVGTNNLLEQSQGLLPDSFQYLPEVLGITPRGADYGGMIIRSIPENILTGRDQYLPMFALLAEGRNGERPALTRMIRASGLSASQFIQRSILRPFVEQWITLAVEQGINMEPHLQNVLIGVGNDGLPNGRFLHRDFGGFSVDLKYRRDLSLPVPSPLPFIRSETLDFSQDEVQMRLGRSIDLHYRAGTLYNIDSSIPSWIQRGWIPTESWTPRQLDRVLREELRTQFQNRYHVSLDFADDYSNMSDAVTRARSELRERRLLASVRTSGQLSRRQACILGIKFSLGRLIQNSR